MKPIMLGVGLFFFFFSTHYSAAQVDTRGIDFGAQNCNYKYNGRGHYEPGSGQCFPPEESGSGASSNSPDIGDIIIGGILAYGATQARKQQTPCGGRLGPEECRAYFEARKFCSQFSDFDDCLRDKQREFMESRDE